MIDVDLIAKAMPELDGLDVRVDVRVLMLHDGYRRGMTLTPEMLRDAIDPEGMVTHFLRDMAEKVRTKHGMYL